MSKKRRAVVIGLPYYAKRLAQMMNRRSHHWKMRAFKEDRWDIFRTMLALRKADVLISFGGPGPNSAIAAAARKNGVRIVVVWAGSDVIAARANPQDMQVIWQQGFHHIADGPWLVDELGIIGLQADYEPLTAVVPGAPVEPFPRTFRVLTHLPEPRRDFYGASAVYQIARSMPEVPFIVIGTGRPSPDAPPNVQFRGYVRHAQECIDECTVFLRLPEHDGKSMMVLEALARGRHVVWNYEFPHVRTVRGAEGALAELRDLREAHADGTLPLNLDGRAFVLEHFGEEKVAACFERRLDRLAAGRVRSERRTRRVAISGLSMFCAEVASYAQTLAPEWETQLLRMNSRLEILAAIASIARSDVWYSIGSPVSQGWLTVAARLFGTPRVLHWVGSDILTLAERPALRSSLKSQRAIHLAEAAWTAEELRRLGLIPRIVALPPRRHHGNSVPLPPVFTVMLYIPRTRSNFYGRPAFERLIESLRGRRLRYVVVGGGELDVPDGTDIENLGWRSDLSEVYKNVSVLARFTPHDGLSLMVLEALSYGRHVVWTQPFPFVSRVTTEADLQREIVALLEAHERGDLRPQDGASELISREYSPETCLKSLAAVWDDARDLRPNSRAARGPLFSSRSG